MSAIKKIDLENDIEIKKYGHNYSEYENLKFFEFPSDSKTKEFCEDLITLKIKLIFIIKFSAIVLVAWICSCILFAFINSDLVNDQKSLLIIAICFVVFSLGLFCFSLWYFFKIFNLIKKVLNYSESQKFQKIKSLKKLSLIYLWTLANIICFGVVTFIWMYKIIQSVMDDLAKDPSILNISKKNIESVIKEKNKSSLLV